MPRISKKAKAARAALSPAPMYRVAVYVRLSDEDSRKKISGSLDNQKTLLTDYIQAHSDLRLFRIYEDVNCTGTHFNRPGFLSLMEDIRAGLADCLLVKDLSRLGRHFGDTGHYLERVFPSLGVRVIAPGDGYDSLTATPSAEGLLVPLKNLMNQVYARDISRKVQAAVRVKQQRGEYCGSAVPYGYCKAGTAFAIDPAAAAVVRQIFARAAAGYGTGAIAAKLNALGVPPPLQYRYQKGLTRSAKAANAVLWYKGTVRHILENRVYLGQMEQHKWCSDFLNGGRTLRTNREEWVCVADTHPPIVDAETFQAVCRQRQARRAAAR